MKLADYVAQFIRELGITHVFVVQGGAVLHLIDAVERAPELDFVCMQHEQACAMAADAQARISGNFGAAMATSGPGATNLITGICSAYYDSVPVIYITGQVATFRNKGNTGVRQIGFQETEIVTMVESITNYSVYVDDPHKIRYELEKAVYLAKAGRPGPVLIDIPDNIQREQVEPSQLVGFEPPQTELLDIESEILHTLNLIQAAERPILILGAGVHLAGAQDSALAFIESLNIPVVPTWSAADIVPSDHPLYIGTFGTHGTRYANFAVQNSDLVLAIGSRLDTKATGSPITVFAREAKKIVVDVDLAELNKFSAFGLDIDLPIRCDAKIFLDCMLSQAPSSAKKTFDHWLTRIRDWQDSYPICPPENHDQGEVNPYVFVKTLSQQSIENDNFVLDTGCCIAWMMQSFDSKPGQRLLHDWNNTAMGWALPASIGVALNKPADRTICVLGDGCLHMNIQELATVIKLKLPIKIFVLNNHGYSMIKQTQDQWMNSRYTASSEKGGMPDPDFVMIAAAYGFSTFAITTNEELHEKVKLVLDCSGPVFCNIEILPDHRVIPQAKFGFPNEDQDPLLDIAEFEENMIVKPIKRPAT